MISTRANTFALLFGLFFPTVVTVAYFVVLAGQPGGQAAYAVGKTLQFAFPLVWVVIVLRERLRIAPPTLRGIPSGLAFGLFVGGSMLLLYHGLLQPAGFFIGPAEAIRLKVKQLGLDTTWKFAAAAVFYSLCHSFLEEYYWRWFVFGQMRRTLALPSAIALSSLGFMAHHVILLAVYFGVASPVTYLFALAIAAGGAVWAWLYHQSDSLYAPWLSHLLVDSAIFIIGFDLVVSR